jgi:hypothetical protein
MFFSQESDYFTPNGEFRVDAAGSPILLNCLMYKLCYHRFGDLQVNITITDIESKTGVSYALHFHCRIHLNTLNNVYCSWTSGHHQVLTAHEMLKLETRMSN